METILDVSKFPDASTVCELHHNASCEAGLGIQDDGGEQLDVVDVRLPCIVDMPIIHGRCKYAVVSCQLIRGCMIAYRTQLS